jgi:hypothetical protein
MPEHGATGQLQRDPLLQRQQLGEGGLTEQQADTGLQHLVNKVSDLKSGQTAHGNSLRPTAGPGIPAQGIGSSARPWFYHAVSGCKTRRCGQAAASPERTDLPHIG